MKTRSNFRDLTGQRFGRLLIIERMPNLSNTPQSIWHGRCDCGVEKFALASSALLAGKTLSCGCLRKELAKYRGPDKYLKGQRNPVYSAYQIMKQRCYNPNANGYENYGGRGITVCQRWLDSFEAFVDDMGERPKDHSIDRINPNGNYEPSNCRWATALTQSQNRRNLIVFQWNGEELCVAEICRREHVACDYTRSMLQKGHSIHEAVRLARCKPFVEQADALLRDETRSRKDAERRSFEGKKLHKRHLMALGRLKDNEENERRKNDIWLHGCMARCAKDGNTYRGPLPTDHPNYIPVKN